jgi:Tfp pilus assembly protein PilO
MLKEVKNEAEVDEVTGERPRGTDRRSAWTDPRFVVPIVIQFFMMLVAVVTMAVTMRLTVSGLAEKIAELKGQVTTLQSLVTTTTEQKGKIEAITDRVSKLENFQETQTKAYNFNFTTRLAAVEARAGIKQPQ